MAEKAERLEKPACRLSKVWEHGPGKAECWLNTSHFTGAPGRRHVENLTNVARCGRWLRSRAWSSRVGPWSRTSLWWDLPPFLCRTLGTAVPPAWLGNSLQQKGTTRHCGWISLVFNLNKRLNRHNYLNYMLISSCLVASKWKSWVGTTIHIKYDSSADKIAMQMNFFLLVLRVFLCCKTRTVSENSQAWGSSSL